MRRRAVLGIAAFAVVLSLGSTCGGSGGSSSTTTTPQVYRIGGSASGTTYNILFLGAGFDSDEELATYRNAVQALTEGILKDTSMPYFNYAGFFSIWRIDVKSGPIDASKCPTSGSSACSHTEVIASSSTVAPTPVETLNPTGAAITERELGVELCYTTSSSSGSCRLVWANADGQRAAAELAAYAPSIDVVVILANTQLWAGATVQAALSASQSLIVIGVPQDASGTAIGTNLLGHELGHAIGLADEYTDSSGVASTSASLYPNVWQPTDACYQPTVATAPTSGGDAEKLIPWFDYLECLPNASSTPPVTVPDPAFNCDSNADFTDYGCPKVWWPYDDEPTCPILTSGLKDECKPYVGLYEGAFYTTGGIYRPADTCKMNNSSDPFCKVCEDVIDDFFTCNYKSPGTCP